MAARVTRREFFNVKDYGAVGNGTTDDTAEFQACFDAAIAVGGTVIIPPPGSGLYYRLTDTVTLEPASGSEFRMNILATLPNNGIIYVGAGDKPVFKTWGWRQSSVQGMHVKSSLAAGSSDNTVVWDIDANSTYSTSSHLLFQNCRVNFDGTGENHVAFRVGHSATTQDLSHFTWQNVTVGGKTNLGTDGHKGYVIEGNNALSMTWLGGWSLKLAKHITNVPTAGAASTYGGGSFFLSGQGGGYNALEIESKRKHGPIVVYGGRFENATQILSVDHTGDLTLASEVSIRDTLVSECTADTLFSATGSVSLTLDNVAVEAIGARAAYGSGLVTVGGSGTYGTVAIRGGHYEATDPIHTVSSGTWDVSYSGVKAVNSSVKATGILDGSA